MLNADEEEDGFISRSGFLQFVYAFCSGRCLNFYCPNSREIIMWNNDKAPGPSKHIPLVSAAAPAPMLSEDGARVPGPEAGARATSRHLQSHPTPGTQREEWGAVRDHRIKVWAFHMWERIRSGYRRLIQSRGKVLAASAIVTEVTESWSVKKSNLINGDEMTNI